MKIDATAMNFDVSKYLNKNVIDYKNSKKFILPDTFDEDTERIIAMVAYYNYKNLYEDSLSMHYYIRNGSGTCNISGHPDTCSIWSHKMGYDELKNTSKDCTVLCDCTIYDKAYDINNRTTNVVYREDDLIGIYTITKDTDIYNSRFINDSSGGATKYYEN